MGSMEYSVGLLKEVGVGFNGCCIWGIIHISLKNIFVATNWSDIFTW